MGFFTKKKSKDDLRNAMMPPKPDLPEFPDMPEDYDSGNYEATIADIKNEVDRDDSFDLPVRNSAIKPRLSTVDTFPKDDEMPARDYSEEKPVFVKIEKYKEAMRHMDVLAKKLSEAQDILAKIEDVRSKEQEKIEEWKNDLAVVKEKLLAVDKELFGG